MRKTMAETHTDAARDDLRDNQLMWRRSFGRPRNDVVLPAGWCLTTSAMPAVASKMADGPIRLSYVNPRPDAIDVFVRAEAVGVAC